MLTYKKVNKQLNIMKTKVIPEQRINLYEFDEQKKLIEQYKKLEKELSDLKYRIKINF